MKQRTEYEDFYEINSDDFNKIINEIFERKYLNCDQFNFCVEMPTKKVELQFLSVNTNDFHERERIKIRYKKNGLHIYYEKKTFNKKHREENTIELSNVVDVYKLINKKIFKAALIKTSLKWPCIDYVAGKKFYIKAEICCAIDTESFNKISNPFFYFEIESINTKDLELFYQTSLNSSIKPFLRGLEFETANKYRKCTKIFKESTIKFDSEEDVLEKIQKIYNIFIKNEYDSKYFIFEKSRIRGEKSSKLHLEKGNCIEKEIKFIPDIKNEEYISNINELLCNQFHIIKAAPRVVFDLYYDTKNDSLYKMNYSFRFRCRKKGSGWVACFKSNAIENSGVLYRNNIRTNMTVEDIINKKNVGETIQSLLKNTHETISEFNPSILIVQKRERFAIRPNNINQIINGEKEKNITYLNQRSELVHIIFDEMEIYNAENIELLPLLYSQEIISKNYNCIRFKTAEIEANEREDIAIIAKYIFERIAVYLDESHIDMLNVSKYALAKELLNEKNIFTNF